MELSKGAASCASFARRWRWRKPRRRDDSADSGARGRIATTGGSSPGWAAATTIGRFVPALLLGSYGGVVAERFERRRLLILLDLISAIVMVTRGIGTGLGVAPLVAIILAAVVSVSAALYLNAAAFLVSAWCSSRLETRSRPSDVSEGGSAGVLRQVIVGASVAASFIYGVDTVLFVVLSEERLGIGANGYVVLMAGLGVGGILMAGFMNRLAARPKLAAIISVALVVYTLPTLLLLWVEDPAIAFTIQIARGAGTLVVDVLAITALQRSLPPAMIARVFGVFITLVLAAISLGAAVAPASISLLGLDGTLVGVTVGATLLVLVVFPLTRRVDHAMAEQLATFEERIGVLEGLGIFANADRSSVEHAREGGCGGGCPRGHPHHRRGRPRRHLLRPPRGSGARHEGRSRRCAEGAGLSRARSVLRRAGVPGVGPTQREHRRGRARPAPEHPR